MAILPARPLWNFLVLTSVLKYPAVRRDVTVIDDYHGTKIADPYQWLENAESAETLNFVEKQQGLTNDFLSRIPQRNEIRERISNVWNYPKFSSPEKAGKRYFSYENTGLQNQSILYVQDDLQGEKRVFLDPNKLSEDGTVALDSYAVSDDGELFAYALSSSGSDWVVIHFKNVTSGDVFPEVLEHSKFPSLTWSKDNKGIFYSRFPTPDTTVTKSGVTENNAIYYHKLGTPQSQDILIAQFPESPRRTLYVHLSDDSEYLIIGGSKEFHANTIHIASLKDGINENLKNKLVPVFANETDASYRYVTNEDSSFLFLTSKNAPNFKLITLDVKISNEVGTEEVEQNKTIHGKYSLLSTFLEEHPKNVLDWATPVSNDKLVLCYLEDVKNILELRSLRDGSLIQKFELEPGTISGFSNDGKKDKEFFFVFQNLISPGTIYHCVVGETAECKVFRQITVAGTDLSKFIVEQKFYPSKDGTLIPMYILRKKDVPLNGQAGTLLYGYGGFNVVLLPRFSISNLVFVDNFDGIYVLANLRGGGEYGEKWHQGGSLDNKQNVFDDFQAAAEYLIANNYTNSKKLAIQGGSNGGLLVAACVNQRPDLYSSAIAQVGVMDMLRFQRFTIGFAWCSEYGCSDDPKQFKTLLKYSPLHNIRMPENETVQYPSVLVTTADHDDRVVPSHSYKYIAELQNTIGQNSRQTNPLLLRVDSKSGHGAGKPTTKKIDEVTDIFTFLSETMDLTFKVQPVSSNPTSKLTEKTTKTKV